MVVCSAKLGLEDQNRLYLLALKNCRDYLEYSGQTKQLGSDYDADILCEIDRIIQTYDLD